MILTNPFDLKSVQIYTPFRARAMLMLVNIQTTSERADKKSGRTMDCLEVTLMWSLLMTIALILLSSIL